MFRSRLTLYLFIFPINSSNQSRGCIFRQCRRSSSVFLGLLAPFLFSGDVQVRAYDGFGACANQGQIGQFHFSSAFFDFSVLPSCCAVPCLFPPPLDRVCLLHLYLSLSLATQPCPLSIVHICLSSRFRGRFSLSLVVPRAQSLIFPVDFHPPRFILILSDPSRQLHRPPTSFFRVTSRPNSPTPRLLPQQRSFVFSSFDSWLLCFIASHITTRSRIHNTGIDTQLSTTSAILLDQHCNVHDKPAQTSMKP